MENTSVFKIGLCIFLTAPITHAFTAGHPSSSVDLHPMMFVAQEQQPVTVADSSVKPAIVNAARGGGLSCPTGYALTAVNAKAEAKTTVTVFGECNGFGNYYVHTWCQNSPTNYSTVRSAPEVTYTCQKIENHWVAVV